MTETLSAQHALAIVEHCPFALLVMDSSNRVIGYNRAFELLLGSTRAGGLRGRRSTEIGAHPARALLSAEGTFYWTDSHDNPHHFEVRHIDLPDTHGTRARLFVDISRQVELEREQAALREELEQLSLTDPVTGLLNQHGIELALEPQVARSRRYNRPLTVIMMGLRCPSESKRILRQMAQLLKDQLRWADLIGYNEQHEFILILPETQPQDSAGLTDKLQQQLDAYYGITGWRRSDNANTLLKRAGKALSRARSEHQQHSIAL